MCGVEACYEKFHVVFSARRIQRKAKLAEGEAPLNRKDKEVKKDIGVNRSCMGDSPTPGSMLSLAHRWPTRA